MSNDIESLRVQATALGITFSGNTGAALLKEKIAAHKALAVAVAPELPKMGALLSGEDQVNVDSAAVAALLGANEELPELTPSKVRIVKRGPPSLAELQIMNHRKVDPKDQNLIRSIVRAKALILRRVSIVNLDPADAELHGAVITVINKYVGKISKFVPFGDEGAGYHVPQIILNQLLNQKFVIRKSKKGGQFGVKTYKSTLIPKFAITILPDLTQDELKHLADRQAASGTVGVDD
jgi:hypothetical protein